MPHPNEVIGTFVLEESIGVGGMGAVFRALDVQLDRLVALKLLPPDQTKDPEIVQRFYEEGRSAARLDHENIARVYSIGQDGPHHFIIFEYIEGETVRQRVDAVGTLGVAETLDITLQIAQALVHAAGRGVVHRDIKPSNIILTPQGRAKLVDMGLARRFERQVDHSLTQSGMTLGTFDYISPEQARDPRDVDVRSDLYSLGCTMFHMLTGRPPFPGGTVLQKLLQHQEDAPPEVQSLNATVPADLAKIIGKLLAKDRDRRYQSPEQLVRDLLVIAGRIGLPVMTSDQHPWVTTRPGITWERHLIWLFPAAAFCLVVAGLVWWSREINTPSSPAASTGQGLAARAETGSKDRSGLLTAKTGVVELTEGEEGLGAGPILPKTITVRSNDDLLAIIATAPPRSTIALVEDGPYRLGNRGASLRGQSSLVNRDLTIKAESGVHPVLSFATSAAINERTPSALLSFSGGNVTIEGVTFEVDRDGSEEATAAILCEDGELSLRQCDFRLTGLQNGQGRSAVRLRCSRTLTAAGDRPPRCLVESCHFDGGQVSLTAEGPTDLLIRNSTFGPGSPVFRFDNGRGEGLVPVELRLSRCSVMAASGPVFAIEGASARIYVDDTVVATAYDQGQASLVATDHPQNLMWRGRYNLYGGLRAYLESTRRGEESEAITGFKTWSQPSSDREVGTVLATASVWKSNRSPRDPIRRLDDPTAPFQLAAAFEADGSHIGAPVGAQRMRLVDSLWTSIEPIENSTANSMASSGTDLSKQESTASSSSDDGSTVPSQSTFGPDLTANNSGGNAARKSEVDTSEEGAGSEELEPMKMPILAPMPTVSSANPTRQADENSKIAVSPSNPSPRGVSSPTGGESAKARSEGNETTATDLTQRNRLEENVIRTAEQFVNVVKRHGSSGGTLRIASGADLELPTTELLGTGTWIIEAESGMRRPRLRFHPSLYAARQAASWSMMLRLSSGSLQIRGVDLLIPAQDEELPRGGPTAAIGVAAGSKLEINECTITVAGRSSMAARLAAIAILPAGSMDPAEPRGEEPQQPAAVTIKNSFIRSTGDAVAVGSNRLLRLELVNALIATDESLLHGLGGSKLSRSLIAIRVRIDRCMARTRGGLIYLESTTDETELPLTDIEASQSVFSTADQSPLFRVDGQGQMSRLQDRILWKADGVAYDQITTYRRDQILQTGIAPQNYTRADWRTAFDPKDESPLVNGVKFRRKLAPSQAASTLTKDDLELVPFSEAAGRGPDFRQLPSPRAES